jgi:hypothetical protein
MADLPRSADDRHARRWNTQAVAERSTGFPPPYGKAHVCRGGTEIALDRIFGERDPGPVTDVRSIAVEASLVLGAGADPRAPGAAVTVALCGHWEHEGRCRWPHNNRIAGSEPPAVLRTVAVVDDESVAEVLRRAESALRVDPRWQVLGVRLVELTVEEQALADRLAG